MKLTLLSFLPVVLLPCRVMAAPHASNASTPAVQLGTLGARAPSTPKSVIAQMFEWSWDSVAQECTNSIGPAGYGYVQGVYARSSV
jgi:hypothetical protein